MNTPAPAPKISLKEVLEVLRFDDDALIELPKALEYKRDVMAFNLISEIVAKDSKFGPFEKMLAAELGCWLSVGKSDQKKVFKVMHDELVAAILEKNSNVDLSKQMETVRRFPISPIAKEEKEQPNHEIQKLKLEFLRGVVAEGSPAKVGQQYEAAHLGAYISEQDQDRDFFETARRALVAKNPAENVLEAYKRADLDYCFCTAPFDSAEKIELQKPRDDLARKLAPHLEEPADRFQALCTASQNTPDERAAFKASINAVLANGSGAKLSKKIKAAHWGVCVSDIESKSAEFFTDAGLKFLADFLDSPLMRAYVPVEPAPQPPQPQVIDPALAARQAAEQRGRMAG